MHQRDPFDQIVHYPPKPAVDPKTQSRQEHQAIFAEQIPGQGHWRRDPRQEDPRARAQVARDEVCILDGRGGHYRVAAHCPHGVLFSEETGTDQEAEYRAMHPIPPASGGILDSGTDFGRGTR